jgi:hypothetical protein
MISGARATPKRQLRGTGSECLMSALPYLSSIATTIVAILVGPYLETAEWVDFSARVSALRQMK